MHNPSEELTWRNRLGRLSCVEISNSPIGPPTTKDSKVSNQPVRGYSKCDSLEAFNWEQPEFLKSSHTFLVVPFSYGSASDADLLIDTSNDSTIVIDSVVIHSLRGHRSVTLFH